MHYDIFTLFYQVMPVMVTLFILVYISYFTPLGDN